MNSRAASIGSIVAVIGLSGLVFSQGMSREIPLGRVTGVVVSKASGKPVKKATVVLVSDDAEYQSRFDVVVPRRVTRTDDEGRFYARNLPVGKYSVSAYSANYAENYLDTKVLAAQATDIKVELENNAPYVNLYAAQHVFMPSEAVELHLNGWVPAASADVALYKLKTSSFADGKGLNDAIYALSSNANQNKNPEQGLEKVKGFHFDLKTRDDEGVFNEQVKLDGLAEGIYWTQVTFQSEKVKDKDTYYRDQRGTYLIVSRIGMVAKVDGKDVVAYVSKLDTGEAVPGAQIGNATSNGVSTLGVTGADGTVRIPLDKFPRQVVQNDEGRSQATQNRLLGLIATQGASTATIGSIETERTQATTLVGHVFSDRPIYRPGDTIQWKAILRSETGSKYSVPAGKPARVVVTDPADNEIINTVLTTNASGSVNGQFPTDPEQTGTYRVQVTVDGQTASNYFSVDSYRKPEFKMTVTPLKSRYYVGDSVQFKVKCEYYFGGPVVGAKLSAWADNRGYWSWYDTEEYDPEDDSEDYSGGEAGYAGDLEASTDNNGEAILTYAPDPSMKVEWYEDRQVTLNVSATESGDKYFDGSGSVILRRGDVSLSVDPDSWVAAANSKTTVTATVRDSVTGDPVVGENVVLMYGHDEWKDNISNFIREDSLNATTDAMGKATFTVPTSDAAEISLKATLHDKSGHEVQAESSIWVSGAKDYGHGAGDLEIHADKNSYRPGETAKVLIRTGKPGGSALLCLEGGTMISYRTVQITQVAQTFEVALPESAFPNALISVARIQNKKFQEASDSVKLKRDDRKLNVTVTPEKKVYKPGQEASYTIEAKDSSGNPVAAEVALGLVDESIYDIRKDSENPYRDFYPHRYSGVRTLYSFPELYLDGGDKTAKMVEIRKDFKDTAYWNPTVSTDATGKAKLSIKLPDNLTSWRATATVVDGDTRVGKATSNIQVRKDLMIRLSMPLYLVRGDEVRISALITNNTGTEKPVQIELMAPGLEIEGDKKQTVNASPTQGTQVTWVAKGASVGTFRVTGTAVADVANDGMELPIQIVPRGMETVDSSAQLVMTESGTLKINKTSEYGSVSIRVEPSISALLGSTIESLVDYPYGCVEQTMSRFLPALAVKALMGDQLSPELKAKIDEVAARSMKRLGRMQHSDGGFGWWEHDESDIAMTGMVLEGMSRAKSLGYPVPESITSRAVQWAESQAGQLAPLKKDWAWEAGDRLQYALGLSLWSPGKVTAIIRDLEKNKLDPENLAVLAMVQRLNGAPETAQKTLGLVKRASVQNKTAAYWPDADRWGGAGNARCLQALSVLSPGDPLVEQVVNYMWQSRRADGWVSTRQTAETIFGLLPWLKDRVSTQSICTYTLLVNGKPMAQGSSAQTVKLAMKDLKDGDNEVVLQKSGHLNAFLAFSVLAKQTPEPAEMQAETKGIEVAATLHELEVAHLGDGTARVVTAQAASTRFESGKPVRYRILLTTKSPMDYVMVHIPRPSNLFVVDSDGVDWWSYDWSGMQVFDDHVALFFRHLDRGMTEFDMNFRAEAPGASVALPVTAYQMYLPEVRGRSGMQKLEVR